MTVSDGTMVSLEFTLKDSDGNLIQTNAGEEPLVYQHGSGQIVAGLEKELSGMAVGESKQVTVSPAEGYGEVDEEAIVELPIDKVPEPARKVGAQLQTKDPEGRELFPTVKEVKESTVTLDFNHPLAGQTLHFEVKVLEVQAAGGQ